MLRLRRIITEEEGENLVLSGTLPFILMKSLSPTFDHGHFHWLPVKACLLPALVCLRYAKLY
jgi:hypothetical protein